MKESRVPVIVGRALACCAHPVIAWRVLPLSERLVVVGAYFGAAYVTVIGALCLMSSASAGPSF
jgi:hypothetical protein